ncbi:hypothetical protein ACR92V_25315, partial [Klebsiella pneumoniae]
QPATGETYPKSDLFNKAVIPLRDVAVVERSNNDAKVRLLIRSSGRSFTLRKKLLAGDKVNDAFAAILAKLTTV